jgi:hypothetical protein
VLNKLQRKRPSRHRIEYQMNVSVQSRLDLVNLMPWKKPRLVADWSLGHHEPFAPYLDRISAKGPC